MTKPRIVAIVQGRMSSSRLPGKVLKELGGIPMLEWVVKRLQLSRQIDLVCVATTTDPSDDAIAEFCIKKGFTCTRGSLYDVLDRFYHAAMETRAQVVVRITADCPLIDPWLVEHVLKAFFACGADFAANRLPPPWKRTYPIGLDTEVCTFAALERAWKEARQTFEREHVMPYLYDAPGRFKVKVVDHCEDLGALRWTVDTPPDLELVQAICGHFQGRMDFTWEEVLEYYRQNPALAEINAEVKHKSAHDVDSRAPRG